MILLHVTTDPRTLAFVLRQMLFMRARGFEVHSAASPGEYESTLRHNSIPFHPVPMHPRINPFSDLVSIARLWLVIRQLRPEILHAHTLKAGLIAMIAASLADTPVRIFHVHGLPHLGARGLRRFLLSWSAKIACRLAHRVFCVSSSVRQVLIDENLSAADKAIVPAHGSCDGIDARHQFNPVRIDPLHTKKMRASHGVPPEAFVVAFIGRLVRHKGLSELGEAWQSLRAAHPGMHLLIVGDFEPQDPIPATTLQMFRADSRVHMVGLCTQMPDLYASVDVVVLPSYYEGFPLVLLEAAAMSLPVVASSIPGNIDAVCHLETGILFQVHDASALARAIERYANDSELRLRHGTAARQRILRDFSPGPVRESVYSEYAVLLGLRKISPPLIPHYGEEYDSDQNLAPAELS